VGLLVLALLSGIAWPLVFLLRLPGIPQNGMEVDAMSRDDEVAVAWLRTQIRPGEIVFRRKPICWIYAQSGGLPGAFTDLSLVAAGFGARVEEREALLRSLPPEADLYRREHIRWFVLDATDAKLWSMADAWINAGVAREAKRVGALRIIELFPRG
jgi:hypothetical protein